MAPAQLEPRQLDEKYHFPLRRLHSLTGIVPIGVFLCEHMLTNSLAFGAGGAEKFNESVHFLHRLPHLLALEVFGIFLPIAFHAVYGIKIALSGQSNISAYPHWDNRRYFLQRLTGYIAFVFMIVHLLKFRFAHWVRMVRWEEAFVNPAVHDKFEVARRGLMEWDLWGLAVPAWIVLTFYVIGLAAACFHFANGIWGFCISWGITIGPKSQQRVGILATAIGIILFIGGSLSLYAFRNAPGPSETIHERTIVDRSAGETAP